MDANEINHSDILRSAWKRHAELDANSTAITDRYIILYDDRVPYLATFQRRCRELYELEVKPDRVYDSHSLRARFDTFRGCSIQSLYEVTNGQAQELLNLGQKASQ